MARFGRTAPWRRVVIAAAAAVAVGTLGLAPAATATAPSGFVPVTTYPWRTNLPGPLSCAAPSFCMELAFGMSIFDQAATVSVLTSSDGGVMWADRGALPDVTGDLGARNLTLDCVSALTCVASDDAHHLRTTDGGATWTMLGGLPPNSTGANPLVTCVSTGACLAVRTGASGPPLVYWLAPGASAFARTGAPLPARFFPETLACGAPSRCILWGWTATPRTPYEETAGVAFVTAGPRPNATWRRTHPTPYRGVTSISCPTASVCVGVEQLTPSPSPAARPLLVLARSTDGGVTWTPTARVAQSLLTALNEPTGATVRCASVRECVVVVTPYQHGNSSVDVHTMLTTDGAKTWSTRTLASYPDGLEQADPQGSAACLPSGRCVADAANFYLYTAGLVATTADGTTWTPVAPPNVGNAATGVSCTTSSTCYRIDEYESPTGYAARLIVSHDDGSTWAMVTLPAGVEPVLLAGCQSATACEVIGVSGVKLVAGLLDEFDYTASSVLELSTSDGGATWTTHRLAGALATPEVASCTSGVACVVLVRTAPPFASPTSALVSTTDGTTWTSRAVPLASIGLSDLPFVNTSPWALACATSGFCLFSEVPQSYGSSAVLVSHDGGTTWAAGIAPGSSSIVDSVACFAADTCDAVYGAAGSPAPSALAQTSNGASSWSTARALPKAVKGVGQLACADASHCVLAYGGLSAAGGALSTTDAGTTWSTVPWHATVLADPSRGWTFVAYPSCSSTACLTEVLGMDGTRDMVETYQLLRMTP